MIKKISAIFLVGIMSFALMFPAMSDCEAKGGGGRTGGFSRSAAPKASAPKASTPKASTSAPKSNTSGYTKKEAPAKGTTSTTNGGGKVTSGGGNTSGYKSKQTQTKEKAQENMAKKDTGSSSNKWYGGTNNHYYGSSYDGGFGHFATGMLYGSLLSSPWHVYAGAPGYVGSYGAAPGVAPTGGFYSPLSGLLGVLLWIVEWSIIFGLLIGAYLFIRRWIAKRKRRNR